MKKYITLIITMGFSSLFTIAEANNYSALVELLNSKGIITQAEANSLSSSQSGKEDDLIKLLTSKGIITEDEAVAVREKPASERRQIAKNTTAPDKSTEKSFVVVAKEKAVTKLTITGRIHAQIDSLSTDYENAPDPDAENNIFLRRVLFGAKADITDSISGTIIGNFGDTTTIEDAFATVSLTSDLSLDIGYRKAPFSYEETTSSSKINAVERSVNTRYFTEQLDLGTRFTGIYLNGSFDSGLYFMAAVTNPEAFKIAPSSSITDKLAIWGRLGWKGEIGSIKTEIGINSAVVPTIRNGNDANDFAYGTYANFSAGNFDLLLEILGANLENASLISGDANPLAFSIMPIWKISDKWEIVGRATKLDADNGIGANISTTFRRAPINGAALYNDLKSFYLGANWFIKGNTLKLSAGYEWANYTENLTGTQGDAEVKGFRTRLQLLF